MKRRFQGAVLLTGLATTCWGAVPGQSFPTWQGPQNARSARGFYPYQTAKLQDTQEPSSPSDAAQEPLPAPQSDEPPPPPSANGALPPGNPLPPPPDGSGREPDNAWSTPTVPSTPVVPSYVPGAAPGSGCASSLWDPATTVSVPWAADGCPSGTCAVGSRTGWFGGAYGLVMGPDDDFDTPLSWDGTNAFPALLSTGDADIEMGGGVETRVGKYLSNRWSVEGVYWGIFPEEQSASVANSATPGDLSSAIGFTGLRYDNGSTVGDVLDWYGAPGSPAAKHTFRHNFESHNLELNFIRNPVRKTGCLHFELLGGVRYVRVTDRFHFGGDLLNETWGDDGANELCYVVATENHLVGFQLGGRMDYTVWRCLSLHLGSKMGLYNNQVRHRQHVKGGNGFAFIDGSSQKYRISTKEDDVAFVGELFAGLSYDVSTCWRLTAGYRAVALSGVARSTSQIPREREFVSLAQAGQIDSGDSLILHGAYMGLEYNW